MNRRQLKKAKKKKGAQALINRNTYLERDNARLRKSYAEAIVGLSEIKQSFDANLGAIARLYGETIEEYSVIEVPIKEIRTVLSDYDVKCSIEGEKYMILVMPKVDPEAE